MHDRRIDGEPYIFGNAGALLMNAMTWWDHKTRTIWSQPWGRAVRGELKGVELFLLPSALTTWGEWKKAHPETLALINDLDRIGGFRQKFSPNFVLGVILVGKAKAYYYRDVAAARVVNDSLGEIPIVVWTSGTSMYAYIRRVGERTLTFRIDGDTLVDVETGSSWNLVRGLAVAGPLLGAGLQLAPGSTAFDWAWRDFYPQSDFYRR